MQENSSIFVRYIRSINKSNLVKLNIITICIFITAKYYIGLDKRQIIQYVHSSLTNGNNAVPFKKLVKNQFHLNIFDREEFIRNEQDVGPGASPCVPTKLEVIIYIQGARTEGSVIYTQMSQNA